MILNGTFPKPLDVRVIKESNSMMAAGHAVTLLCLEATDEVAEERIDGLNVVRINAGKSINHLAFWDIIISLTFNHPIFRRGIRRILAKQKIDAIHVHDLPLAGTALYFKRKYGIKVVLDLHENYSEALKIWFRWKTNPIARLKNALFLRPKVWERYEAKAVRAADAVLTVVNEMRDRVLRQHELDEKKVFVVSNTETKTFIDQPVIPEIYAAYPGKFILAYVGGIGPHRGVDTVIESMQYLRNQQDIVFIIIGSGSSNVMEKLGKMVRELRLGDRVFMLGQKPFSQVFSYMSRADVNVIPHKSNPQNDNGVPHKLFQSMMVGKPVLVSSSAPLKRIIEETSSGVVFQAEDPVDCADKIVQMFNNKSLCQQLGANGKKAAMGKYSWEETAKQLLDVYEGLVHREPKA